MNGCTELFSTVERGGVHMSAMNDMTAGILNEYNTNLQIGIGQIKNTYLCITFDNFLLL